VAGLVRPIRRGNSAMTESRHKPGRGSRVQVAARSHARDGVKTGFTSGLTVTELRYSVVAFSA